MSEPSIADRPRQVRIASGGHTARVEVDGHDISRSLQGFTLEQRAMQPPLLVLFAGARTETVFEGLAHVVVGEQAEEVDHGELIAAFIANIDPKALENAALNREDVDDERYALTRAMLTQLADWAQGKGGS